MRRRTSRRTVVVAAFAVAVFFSIAAFAAETAEAAKVAAWVKALPPPAADSSWFGVLGATNLSLIGPPVDSIRSIGPRAFYNTPSLLQQSLNTVQDRSAKLLPLLVGGGMPWFRDVQNVPWGMIEVARGETRWELLDAILAGSQTAGGRYVGVVMPFASWELVAAGYPVTSDAQCLQLMSEDHFYLAMDKRMDRYKDLAEWKAFLAQVAERYDGDGVNDMPGLVTPIKVWQIHNEPEGNHCGLFRDDAAAFVELMRASSEAIKGVCGDCKVMNGGAGIPLFFETKNPVPGGVNFWSEFAAAGGAPYVDVIAVHYNQGKDADHGKIDDFEYQVRRAREILGSSKPVWVTEFGTLIGDGGGRLMGLPEAEAGAWFLRFYTAGLAAGVSRFFSDSIAFVTFPNPTIELPYYINKLLTARLGGFTAAQKVAAGQYRFTVGGSEVWVLWNGVPSSLTGSVLATDLYGNESTVDAKSLAPSEKSPLIVGVVSGARRRGVRH